MKTCCFASLLIIASSYAAPLNDGNTGIHQDDPELTAGYFEGDIDLGNARNGLIPSAMHWPGGIVHYKIDHIFDQAHANHIRHALNAIEELSCIRFYPATTATEDFINFNAHSEGCFTMVGYHGGEHKLNLELYPLDKGCFRMGTIMHETLHALGFFHQQSAADRDNYVKIVIENITPGNEHNFDKYDEQIVTEFGIGYDYGSVMHYSATAFTRNGKATIVPLKHTNAVMGQREGLSQADIAKLNIMYDCGVTIEKY